LHLLSGVRMAKGEVLPFKVRPRAAEAWRRADAAERRATVANERLDRCLRERITRAQADAERQGRDAAERELASRKASGPLARVWRALARRRGTSRTDEYPRTGAYGVGYMNVLFNL
jgi:MoxR-like ATPase